VLKEMERRAKRRSENPQPTPDPTPKPAPKPSKKAAAKKKKGEFKDVMDELSYKLAVLRGEIVEEDEDDAEQDEPADRADPHVP
jgi:hypothetical protein